MLVSVHKDKACAEAREVESEVGSESARAARHGDGFAGKTFSVVFEPFFNIHKAILTKKGAAVNKGLLTDGYGDDILKEQYLTTF